MPWIASRPFEALERGLARASATAFESGYEKLLADLFALDIHSKAMDVPTGALLAQQACSEKLHASQHWLRAVPVNLVPDRDRLLLHRFDKKPGIQDSHFTNRITREMLRVFEDLFAEIIVTGSSDWLVRLNHPARIITSSSSEVAGNNIRGFLPEGSEASQWIAVFNEIQMILHAAGSSEHGFNALWFEGVGPLPVFKPFKIISVGNENLFQAISDYCQAETMDDLDNFSNTPSGMGKLIVCNTKINQAIDEASEEKVLSSLQTVNTEFTRILSLLDKGRLSQVHLYLLNGNRYSIGRAGMLGFLKKRKKLSELL